LTKRDEQADVAALPDGSRDVLPVEAAELTAIEASLRETFAAFGYREVRTPLLEFAEVMDRAQEGGIGRAFRMFDDHGQVLVVRPDLTIPVARLVAGRLVDHPGPVRVTYISERARPAPAGRAQRAEELQAGIELVGMSGPAADAEVIAAVVGGLRALGIDDLRVALGDVSLTRAVLDGTGVDEADQVTLGDAVRARNLVAWRRAAEALPLGGHERELIAKLPTLRGGRDVLSDLASRVPAAEAACTALLATLDLLDAHGAGDAVMVDLGVLRDWGYYSGVVMEAYAPGVGRPVAVGGRYDGLVGKFGAARPAIGAAVILDRLHEAIAARNGNGAPQDGIVLAGGLDADVVLAAALRAQGHAVAGVPDDAGVADRLAEADGWRFVARRSATGFSVTDRLHGESFECHDLQEELKSRRS
jgi:ATP phosphoribosyltransferase regulatory subunit